jgi:Uma2 family endonuclease
VVSRGTKSYDREGEFNLYRSIASLREYILIDSGSVKMEIYRIVHNGNGELKEHKKMQHKLFVRTVLPAIPPEDIAERTEFEVNV